MGKEQACWERRLMKQPDHHSPVLIVFTFPVVTFLLQLFKKQKQKQNQQKKPHVHSASPQSFFYLFSINEKARCVPKGL